MIRPTVGEGTTRRDHRRSGRRTGNARRAVRRFPDPGRGVAEVPHGQRARHTHPCPAGTLRPGEGTGTTASTTARSRGPVATGGTLGPGGLAGSGPACQDPACGTCRRHRRRRGCGTGRLVPAVHRHGHGEQPGGRHRASGGRRDRQDAHGHALPVRNPVPGTLQVAHAGRARPARPWPAPQGNTQADGGQVLPAVLGVPLRATGVGRGCGCRRTWGRPGWADQRGCRGRDPVAGAVARGFHGGGRPVSPSSTPAACRSAPIPRPTGPSAAGPATAVPAIRHPARRHPRRPRPVRRPWPCATTPRLR